MNSMYLHDFGGFDGIPQPVLGRPRSLEAQGPGEAQTAPQPNQRKLSPACRPRLPAARNPDLGVGLSSLNSKARSRMLRALS